jgi:hypothetical protein
MTNPVTHVDGHLIWPGGHSRMMTRKERVLWKFARFLSRNKSFNVQFVVGQSKKLEPFVALRSATTVGQKKGVLSEAISRIR